jgi:predicted O-linked N-acetylglucosamine transferase (SPINDLY family)
VVARESDWFRSRQGAAILRDVDLGDWVARSEADYLALAGRLAADPTLRQSIRHHLTRALAQPPRCLDSRAYAVEVSQQLMRALEQWQGDRVE